MHSLLCSADSSIQVLISALHHHPLINKCPFDIKTAAYYFHCTLIHCNYCTESSQPVYTIGSLTHSLVRLLFAAIEARVFNNSPRVIIASLTPGPSVPHSLPAQRRPPPQTAKNAAVTLERDAVGTTAFARFHDCMNNNVCRSLPTSAVQAASSTSAGFLLRRFDSMSTAALKFKPESTHAACTRLHLERRRIQTSVRVDQSRAHNSNTNRRC